MPSLPSFRVPPINELVLSLQFATLSNLRTAHIGLFWELIRSKYSVTSEQTPLPPFFETFGGTRIEQNPTLRIETLFVPPFPRFWFENTQTGDLLQIQQDRFIRNWRQSPENSRIYPRYEAVRDAFAGEAHQFEDWLGKEGLGQVLPNQCEVTYINLITLPDGTNPHQQLERVTGLWSGQMGPDVEHSVENTNIQLTCLFHQDGKPAGRIYANFQAAYFTPNMVPVVRLDITARGKPAGEDIAAALTFMDVARAQAVNTFAALTTPEMHEFWGRIDA